jgi:hypothetical protein
MYYQVTLYFGKAPVKFKVLGETATGALISVLAWPWTVEERKAFKFASVDTWTGTS